MKNYYTIMDKEGVPFGFFDTAEERDHALKNFCFGFPGEREIKG